MSTATIIACCPSCHARNRVPLDAGRGIPVCSTCRAHLLPEAPIALDDNGFATFAARSELPLVVDFFATWCGPCRALAPGFASASRDFVGRAVFAVVDVDRAPVLASKFRVGSVPTLLVVRGGAEVARHIGAPTPAGLRQWVEAQLQA